MTQNLSSFNSLVTPIQFATVNILTLEKSKMTDINGLIQTVNLSLSGQEVLGTYIGVDTRQKLLLTLQCLQDLVILLTRVKVISRFNISTLMEKRLPLVILLTEPTDAGEAHSWLDPLTLP